MKTTFSIFTVLCAAVLSLMGCKSQPAAPDTDKGKTPDLTAVAFCADSAYASVVKQCSFGPRIPNSEAHQQCGDYIVGQFNSYGLHVEEQRAVFTGWDGAKLNGRNIIASYKPEATERIVFAAHWDCRPWADADPNSDNHRQPVMGANDGASGVAVMIEMARCLKELKPSIGIDFICFDMEDYGAPYWGTAPNDGSDWCLGSQYWAAQAAANGYTARYGILLDMVGGMDARFCREGFSLQYAGALVQRIWQTAATVGASSLFVDADGSWATDDHVPMNTIAGVPTVDIIPYIEGEENSFGATWHTINDTPENISPENLRLVGQTMLQMIYEESNI